MWKWLSAITIFICILFYLALYDTKVSYGSNIKYVLTKLVSKNNCTCKIKSHDIRLLTNTLKLNFPGHNMTTEEHIKAGHPNFPVDFFKQNRRCHLLPDPMGIKWVNTVWQQYTGPSGHQVYLYSAFYDNRIKNEIRPSVGVLGVTKEEHPDVGWCYLWTDASKPPIVTKVIKTEYIDWQPRKAARMKPYLFSCAVPTTSGEVQTKPLAVSLAANPCGDVTNVIKVNGESFRNMSIAQINDTSTKQLWNTAVCGPALFYFQKDFSLRIVEWFEVLKALGIAKVFLYEADVHPNIKKVLDYYEAIGYAQVTKFMWPPPYINDPSLRIVFTRAFKNMLWSFEDVYFTDCVLRHMHEYRFIAHLDPDELPILGKHDSFPKLMDELLRMNTKHNSFYKLKWKFFNDNIPPSSSVADLPETVWALRHDRYSKSKIPHNNGKSIYDMDSVATVYSHGASSEICNGKKCKAKEYRIPEKVAYLGHFKGNCDDKCKKIGYGEETAYKKIRDNVQKSVNEVIKTIGLSVEAGNAP